MKRQQLCPQCYERMSAGLCLLLWVRVSEAAEPCFPWGSQLTPSPTPAYTQVGCSLLCRWSFSWSGLRIPPGPALGNGARGSFWPWAPRLQDPAEIMLSLTELSQNKSSGWIWGPAQMSRYWGRDSSGEPGGKSLQPQSLSSRVLLAVWSPAIVQCMVTLGTPLAQN